MTALLFLTTVLIWGTTFYAITLQLGDVPAMQSVFYRFAIAAVVMWVLTLIRKTKISCPGQVHVLFAVLGLLMFSLNYVVVYIATGYLVSGLVSVIFSLIIPFNILFYWLIFHEKPSLALVIGSLFGIVGITALFIEDFYGITISDSVVLGICLALLSTIMASAGNIIAQLLKLRNINVAACNTWGMSYGTLFLLIAVVIAGEPWQFSLKIDYIFSLLYLSLAGTVIAFWTYLTLLHRIGAPRAAYITVIFPLVALLVSTLYEDMHWTGFKFLGVALIVAGNVFIIQRKQSVEN
ncbi:MAG: DMT family transporter [Gammaproteobacteria bacterium]|jgi:drug/metabolite transporter (DMT)-like permease